MGNSGGSSGSDWAKKTAKQLYFDTDPARQNILARGNQFLEGGLDPAASPVWEPTKNVLEGQYQNARENIIGNMPVGGAMQSGLADLEVSRANQISSLGSNIAQDEYNKIYGLVSGTPQQSLGTLTNLAGTQAAAQAQKLAGKYGALGDIGGGAGMMFGMKGGNSDGGSGGK